MRVLQINSVCGFGSTGRTVEELANFLLENGHESFVAFGHGKTNFAQSYKYGQWIEKKAHALQTRLSGKQGLGSEYGTRELINYIEKVNPHIVHLRNLHGNHINFAMLFSFLANNNYPVVWTLHDCWAFTGVCFHYTAVNCYKWKTACNRPCPHHHAWLPNNRSDTVSKMFELKRSHFTSIKKMEIVTVSKWLGDQAKQSYLSKYPIQHIYNWVDLNKFKPNNEDISQQYRIPIGKKIVLGVAAKWTKNSTKYQDAMKLLELLPGDMCMVMVGALEKGTVFPEEIIHIPYLHSTDDLAKIYSAAMVYVHFSVEDTFGKVVAEAMACGTPAIVFNSTALPELVGDGSGYVVEPHDVVGINNCITQIKKLGKKAFRSNCIEKVKQSFDARKNMQLYLNIYKSLV
jgi:putative colanic acid biosynthesis glycosyltransferase